MDTSSEYKLSKELTLDPSQRADIEMMAVVGNVEKLSGIILTQSNMLKGYSDAHLEHYVATEDGYETRKFNSFCREKSLLYLQELLNLCVAENVNIPERIRKKANFALLRGQIGRVEELQDIVKYDRESSHIFPELPRKLASPSLLLEMAETEVYRKMQDLGITDHNMN